MDRSTAPCPANDYLAGHVACLLASLRALTGADLAPGRTGTEAARFVYEAPFVLLSHDTAADPVFNYANQAAQSLFELDWPAFIALPSRFSAEAPNREERARLLDRVTRQGYIDDYSGVRIARSGRRFMIDQAMVWNVADAQGRHYGQAATFSHWRFL